MENIIAVLTGVNTQAQMFVGAVVFVYMFVMLRSR